MRQVIWSRAARRDLDAIEDFWISRPDYRATLLRAAAKATALLAEFPAAGSTVGIKDARKLPLNPTPYLLLYRFDAQIVRILRIRHEREDWRPQR